jgi:hypothetical protein
VLRGLPGVAELKCIVSAARLISVPRSPVLSGGDITVIQFNATWQGRSFIGFSYHPDLALSGDLPRIADRNSKKGRSTIGYSRDGSVLWETLADA